MVSAGYAAAVSADLPIRCSCDATLGVLRSISPRTANRGRCYCDDCQTFAHFLGRANEVLDEHGGTQVLQTSPKRFELHRGREQVACVQLRPDGLLRWYTKCCGTPLGNTLRKPWVPFVGVIEACVRDRPDRRTVDEVAGPVVGSVYRQYARGDRNRLPQGQAGTVGMSLRVLRIVLGAFLRREHRRSPFFDQASRQPSVKPYVLSPSELSEVEALRDAWQP